MAKSPRHWDVWRLPPAARALVIVVPCSYVAVVTLVAFHTSFMVRDIGIAAAFTLAAVASIEISMRLAWPRARSDRVSRDCLTAWILPVALVLPPLYVAVMATVPSLYLQARVWRAQLMKLVYSIASIGLGYTAAAEVHVAIAPAGPHSWTTTRLIGSTRADLALAAAVAVWWVGHNFLICSIVALTAGFDRVKTFLRDIENHAVDLVIACVGIVFAVLWSVSPVAAALLVPPVLLLQHQFFSNLRAAVRTDQLTELASAPYWRDVASREVHRASAAGAEVSLLVIDLDNFKSVNDVHGHLVGDAMLSVAARAIVAAVRPRDLVGRLGGEEFGVILAGLNLLDAEGAAQRVREQVGAARLRTDDGGWLSVTASIGVAAVTVNGDSFEQVLTAADRAMYAAKAAGRNCVRAAGPMPGQVIDLTPRPTSVERNELR